MDVLDRLTKDREIGHLFALKGGTALNLFYLGLDRLSVDIDLNYVGAEDRKNDARRQGAHHEASATPYGELQLRTFPNPARRTRRRKVALQVRFGPSAARHDRGRRQLHVPHAVLRDVANEFRSSGRLHREENPRCGSARDRRRKKRRDGRALRIARSLGRIAPAARPRAGLETGQARYARDRGGPELADGLAERI
ncbi:nucleotidyl transferase AbiEii/AbiGii toxin family protein [Bradyrhizobium sp. 147]|uniref:nucleotidyl transferase AbiEii/AbiGii toxin family protein n=1 Tax=unclassified Bradyrhizobium TaxID=2631580 RepID=UPI00320A2DE4